MSFTDQLGIVDSQLANIVLAIGVNGTGSNVYTPSFSDGLTFVDTMVGYSLEELLSDTLTFVDTMVGNKNLFLDTFTFTDTLTPALHVGETFSDTLVLSDVFFQTFTVSLSDTVTLTDDVEGGISKTGSITESITLSDTFAPELIEHRTIFESLILLEQLTAKFVRSLNLSDTFTFSDTFVGIDAKALKDIVTFSDTMSGFVSKTGRDFLDLGDVISENSIRKFAGTDQLVLYDLLTTTNYIRRTLSDVLSLTDTLVGVRVKPLADTLVLTDSIAGVATVPISDTLTLTELFQVTKTQAKSYGDTLAFNEVILAVHTTHQSILDTIGFVDTMTGLRQRFGNFSDTLTFTDHQLREVFSSPINETLTFSDTMSAKHIGEEGLSDTVVFTDSMHLTKTTKTGRSDLVIFSEGFVVRTTYASTPVIIQIINQNTVAPTTPPGDDYPYDLTVSQYTPTPVWQGVVTVLKQVVLTGLTTSIVLPPPEFNDFSANQGKIAVNRAMSGKFRVYRKTTPREVLNWRFVLPKYKADEFKAFLLAEITNPINLLDFDGHYWTVNIKTDSIDFTESRRWSPGGNAVEVTIELEGIRYA